jgi:hypothetical protein
MHFSVEKQISSLETFPSARSALENCDGNLSKNIQKIGFMGKNAFFALDFA